MKKRESTFTLLLFIFIFYNAVAQSESDSLLLQISKEKSDQKKADLLFELSEICPDKDIMRYSMESFGLSEKIHYEKGMVNALGNIGYAYNLQGQSDKALEHYLRALSLAEKNNYEENISVLCINLGNVYYKLQQNNRAIGYFNRALDVSQKGNDKKRIISTLNSLGAIYIKTRPDSALDAFRRTLYISRETGDKLNEGSSLYLIGGILTMQGKMDSARYYLSESIRIYERIGYRMGYAASMNSIGWSYLEQNRLKEAESYCSRALTIAREEGNAEVIKLASERLSRIYASSGKYKDAYDMQSLFKKLADSMNNFELQRSAIEKQMQYEFEKKEAVSQVQREKEKAIAQEKDQKQVIVIWSVVLVLIVSLFLGGIAYRKWRIEQQQNDIILSQKIQVDKKNQHITDSIGYAQRIQQAILPDESLFKKSFAESFVWYKPKDIVSGDFYWIGQKDGKTIFAAADCTGHGVPGAFMSMIGNTLLNEIINEKSILEPDEILGRLREGLTRSLKQEQDQNTYQDGMELALCVYDPSLQTVEFSGSYSPLYIISDGRLQEYPGNSLPIGFKKGNAEKFDKVLIRVSKGDVLYLFTDGFPDQKGERSQKKFYYKPFRELLLSIHPSPMEEQKKILETTLTDWKGSLEQIDDILVIGVRI